MPVQASVGCTLLIRNIPRDMDLGMLKADVDSHGRVVSWRTPPGPVHVYVEFETKDMATKAMIGLREHRRLVVDYACVTES